MLSEAERGRSGGDDQRSRRFSAHSRSGRQLHPGLQRTALRTSCLGRKTGK